MPMDGRSELQRTDRFFDCSDFIAYVWEILMPFFSGDGDAVSWKALGGGWRQFVQAR